VASKIFALCLDEAPATDQGSYPSMDNQKLRPDLELCRSSTDMGDIKKEFCPVLISPWRLGDMEDIMPASFTRGKYR
jgi:hypothetical protein